jgi:hypothetical protein
MLQVAFTDYDIAVSLSGSRTSHVIKMLKKKRKKIDSTASLAPAEQFEGCLPITRA